VPQTGKAVLGVCPSVVHCWAFRLIANKTDKASKNIRIIILYILYKDIN
jgi:hypothetical protein